MHNKRSAAGHSRVSYLSSQPVQYVISNTPQEVLHQALKIFERFLIVMSPFFQRLIDTLKSSVPMTFEEQITLIAGCLSILFALWWAAQSKPKGCSLTRLGKPYLLQLLPGQSSMAWNFPEYIEHGYSKVRTRGIP